MHKMNCFKPFIYGLVDPVEPCHVRYVGMANVRALRPYDHAKNARRKEKHSHLLHWIRSLQSNEREPKVIVLEELQTGTSTSFVGTIERYYIKALREIGHRLTNVTDGGESGVCGPFSVEFRAKVGAASKRLWQDTEHRAKMKAARTGLKRSDEARANMSAAQKGRVVKEATRIRIALANLGKFVSPETRSRQSASIKAAKTTPEARAAAAAKQKSVWARRKAQKVGVPSTSER